MIEHDPYLYPGSNVLKNRFGIRDGDVLNRFERRLVTERISEGVPKGRFDLDHLRAIHRHLFQDVYDWAGELRTVEISKGGDLFQLRRFIVRGMADVHGRLERAHFLKNLNRKEFAEAAAAIIGDVNYVHPFREGNGRTQMQYLAALAEQAGHPLDLCLVDPARWLHASRAAHQADYRPMSAEIENVLAPF